jgi:uncharacterized membrane protein YraQ (UPF0718 family)
MTAAPGQDEAPSGGGTPAAAATRTGPPVRGGPAGGKRRRFKVDTSVFWILGMALIFTVIAYLKSPSLAYQGGEIALRLLVDILPSLLAGLLLGAMIQVLVPKELVAGWAGEGSGLKGLAFATAAGAITPGGPFVQFPLIASLWQAGAGVGPVTAYLISWTLIGVNKLLIWEVPVMGWRYTIAKTLACLAVPLLVGWLTALIFERMEVLFS